MTKELMEQYPDICVEITELEKRMRSSVTDTVSGSSAEYPYNQHPVSIRGVPPEFSKQLDILKKQKSEIEQFVFGLKDSGQRCLVTLRALQGLSWAQVAARMGVHYTEEKAKKRYQRFLKNFF